MFLQFKKRAGKMKRNAGRMTVRFFGILSCIALLQLPQAVSFAQVIPQENFVHVEKTLSSEYLQLNLDADVFFPDPDTLLPIYTTDYAIADDGMWKEMFFGSANAPVTDERAGGD